MPFDTTYYFYSKDTLNTIQYIVPGGKDTSIYLKPGQFPPGMDYEFMYGLKNVYAPTEQTAPNEPYSPGLNFIFSFIVIFTIIVLLIRKRAAYLDSQNPDPVKEQAYLTYYGSKLDFPLPHYTAVLSKHFPYFNSLNPLEKQRFIERLKKFMSAKVFKIHDKKGFKEMPILISATAIQVSFGLERFLLPNFRFIHIYPKEFIRIKPVLCFLEGNVSGHSIKLSWKHFMEGIKDARDGKNVGLHEMAHALYYQTFVTEKYVDTRFRKGFDSFNAYGNKVFNLEQLAGNNLYSDYAMKDFQEFWAESIELFFEQPAQLNKSYPLLYAELVNTLNQDPLKSISGKA